MSTIAERVAQLTAALPPEKQAEVLDFVEFLRARAAPSGAPSRAEEGAEQPTQRLGFLRGDYRIAEDFDGPLPPDIQRYFEGEDDEDYDSIGKRS